MSGLQFWILVGVLLLLGWEANRRHTESLKATYKAIGLLDDIKNALAYQHGGLFRQRGEPERSESQG